MQLKDIWVKKGNLSRRLEQIDMAKNKKHSIEALRFIFMLVIAVWHFGRVNPFTHGYIAVDFYFILSGYLLYGSYIRHKYDALVYTVEKLRRFYPEYIFVFIIAFLMKVGILLRENDYITVFLNAISEGLLIHGVGVYDGNVNPTSWYISVLLLGGGLLYAMLYCSKRVAVGVLFPLIVLLGYTALLRLNGSLEQFSSGLFISECLLRGMAGMSLGVILAVFVERYSTSLEKSCLLLNVACVLAVVIVSIALFSVKHYDRFALLAFCILIISCFVPSTLINRVFASQLWTRLGGITFEMLLVHCPVIWVVNNVTRSIDLPKFGLFVLALLYVVLVLVCSFSLKFIVNKLKTIKR